MAFFQSHYTLIYFSKDAGHDLGRHLFCQFDILAFLFPLPISHSTHRTFGKQQWQQLYDSLSSWKANLATVKTSLQALSPSA